MKTNKGIAPIAMVLIVIAVLAVGGISYYAGKKSDLIQPIVKKSSTQNQNLLIAEKLKKDYSINDCDVISVQVSPDNTQFLVNRSCKATDKEAQDYCGGMDECYGADWIGEQIIIDTQYNQIFSSGRKYLFRGDVNVKQVSGFVEKNLLDQ